MNAAIPVILATALLGASGSFFGVVIARSIWADDLKHAQRIDEIRSRTEGHLRRNIQALEDMIDIYKKRLGE